MNERKGIRLWQLAVLLLVLCNIGLIVTIWLRPGHDGPPHGRGPRDFVIQKLNFDAEQVKKYDVLIQAHQQAMGRLKQEAMGYRKALFANLKNEYQSNSITDSLTRSIGNNQKEIEIVTYNHFVEVRNICTDAQKKEFDNIIGDVIKRMNGGPGGPHPPPPGDGRDHPGPPGKDGPPPPGDDGPPPPPPGDR